MNLYYRANDPTDLRDIGDQVQAWQAAGNPKAADWIPAPVKPSPEAIWVGGGWVEPTPPPPIADWGSFKEALLNDPAANAALAAAAMSAKPGAALSIPAALIAVAQGAPPVDFYVPWRVLRQSGQISSSLLEFVVAKARECNLPMAFIEELGAPVAPFD